MPIFGNKGRFRILERNQDTGKWDFLKAIESVKVTKDVCHWFLWFEWTTKEVESIETIDQVRERAVREAKLVMVSSKDPYAEIRVQELFYGTNSLDVWWTVWQNGRWQDLPEITNFPPEH